MDVRAADAVELDCLARIWFDGWQDAHAAIAPAELTRRRTLASFRERLPPLLSDTRVVGLPGDPLGFAILIADELYQLYVTAPSRGRGVAAALMADAEKRLAAAGVGTAWLACAIGNDRAARFYEKQGWRRSGIVTSQLETDGGVFSLDVWKYEKALTRSL